MPGAHPTLETAGITKVRVLVNIFCRWMLLYRCLLRTARRADVGPLHEIGKEDSKPIKWRRIISIGRLRMAKVHREHAPKAARAADDSVECAAATSAARMISSSGVPTKKIARGNVVHYDLHPSLQRGGTGRIGVAINCLRNISEIRLKSPGLQRSSGNRSRHRGAEASPCQRRLLRSRNPGSDAEVHSKAICSSRNI